MPKLTAIKEHRYGGKLQFAGDDYEATDRDAKLLTAVGKAKLSGDQKRTVDLPAKAMEVKKEPAPLAEPNEYLRRDMQAVGRTGEESRAPSSHRGRRPRGRTSPSSKGDAE